MIWLLYIAICIVSAWQYNAMSAQLLPCAALRPLHSFLHGTILIFDPPTSILHHDSPRGEHSAASSHVPAGEHLTTGVLKLAFASVMVSLVVPATPSTYQAINVASSRHTSLCVSI